MLRKSKATVQGNERVDVTDKSTSSTLFTSTVCYVLHTGRLKIKILKTGLTCKWGPGATLSVYTDNGWSFAGFPDVPNGFTKALIVFMLFPLEPMPIICNDNDSCDLY